MRRPLFNCAFPMNESAGAFPVIRELRYIFGDLLYRLLKRLKKMNFRIIIKTRK